MSASRLVPVARIAARLAGIVAAVLMAESAIVSVPADAQTAGSIELISQSVWVAPTGQFEIELEVSGPSGTIIELVVYPRVVTRSRYQSSIDDGPRGIPLFTSEPIEVGASTVVPLAVPVTVLPEAGRLTLTDAGVYPVEIALLDVDGTRLDQFVTHLVTVPESVPADDFELLVALTLPIDTNVSLHVDGGRTLSAADQSQLAVLTDSLRSASDVPVTVSVSPETLAAVDRRALSDLRASLVDRLLLSRPYVDIDPTAWLDAGLDSEFIDTLGVGLTTTNDVLGRMPDTSLWLANQSLTSGHLVTLGGLGYQRFLLHPEQLEELDLQRFPRALSQQFLIEDSNGRRYPSAVTDSDLADRFSRGVAPQLAAYNLLAELVIVADDPPDVQRGVVVAPPVDWVPDASFLRIVLGGLANHPRLEPVTLDSWFDQVSPANEAGQRRDAGLTLDRVLEPERADDLSVFSVRYTSAAADLFSFGSVVGDDSDAVAELNDLLLVAGSNDLTERQSSAYLTEIETTVRQATGAIQFDLPSRVTLAAREGDVPIVIENTLDSPISILVSLSSDKLEFPAGNDASIDLVPGINRVSVAVAARTSGDSVLNLTFSSPDRAIDLGSSRVIVRSTALSGVGVIIAALALVFLLVWWLRARRSQARSVSH